MGAKSLLSNVMYGSKLAFQSLGLVTQTSMKRRKAKATFTKTMVDQGVPLDIANEIAKEFPNPVSDLFSILKSSAFAQNK
ncbi:MAG: hypothetical protein NUK63_08885 [Candidatus Bathyarchaeum tardum]|nr:MAG: hypothetical protein NUK63_08885 [Candidatus Bathyarchaeum tardum]